jgi:hypothetical protein
VGLICTFVAVSAASEEFGKKFQNGFNSFHNILELFLYCFHERKIVDSKITSIESFHCGLKALHETWVSLKVEMCKIIQDSWGPRVQFGIPLVFFSFFYLFF